MSWQDDQTWESSWWGNCANTYGEETKQLVYAQRMGLTRFHDGKSPFNFDLRGLAVVDIGGGPCSLLLKCHNVRGLVIDPCEYPQWVMGRYDLAGLRFKKMTGEEVSEVADEAWIYNVLQHTQAPSAVIARALASAKIVRLFEWIDTYVAPGHPHVLTAATLDEWLGGMGQVEEINEGGCVGRCYYGIFKGEGFKA